MRYLLAPVVLLAAVPAAAQMAPLPPPPGDPRFQTVEYQPDRVVQLQAAPGFQLTVELAPDEKVESVAVGDSAAWQVTPNRRGDHLFIKPIQNGVATNMTVVTDTRTYLFDLVPLDRPQPGMAYILRFHYLAAAEVAADPPAAADAESWYRVSGTRALRPSAIGDDGRRTYIEWPADATLPAVYTIDSQGKEALVNGMMRDGVFVIDSVEPRLVFRIDRQTARAVRKVPRGKH